MPRCCVRPRPQMNPQVGALSLYDVGNTKGVAADVSHINSAAKVEVRIEQIVCACCGMLCRSPPPESRSLVDTL